MDIIGQHEKLDGYRIVCAPEMYVTDEAAVQRLHDFAAKGGTVILTTRSGAKDAHNNAIMAQLPTVYRGMVGACAEEYNPIGYDSVAVRFEDGTRVSGKQWCDVLQTEGAQVLARYDGEYFAGKPVITRNAYGSGSVYYIGTVGNQALYSKVARGALEAVGLEFNPDLPPQVEITARTGESGTTRFVFNNSGREQTLTLDGKALTLAPFEMYIDHQEV